MTPRRVNSPARAQEPVPMQPTVAAVSVSTPRRAIRPEVTGVAASPPLQFAESRPQSYRPPMQQPPVQQLPVQQPGVQQIIGGNPFLQERQAVPVPVAVATPVVTPTPPLSPVQRSREVPGRESREAPAREQQEAPADPNPADTWVSFLDRHPEIAATIGEAGVMGSEAFKQATMRLSGLLREKGINDMQEPLGNSFSEGADLFVKKPPIRESRSDSIQPGSSVNVSVNEEASVQGRGGSANVPPHIAVDEPKMNPLKRGIAAVKAERERQQAEAQELRSQSKELAEAEKRRQQAEAERLRVEAEQKRNEAKQRKKEAERQRAAEKQQHAKEVRELAEAARREAEEKQQKDEEARQVKRTLQQVAAEMKMRDAQEAESRRRSEVEARRAERERKMAEQAEAEEKERQKTGEKRATAKKAPTRGQASSRRTSAPPRRPSPARNRSPRRGGGGNGKGVRSASVDPAESLARKARDEAERQRLEAERQEAEQQRIQEEQHRIQEEERRAKIAASSSRIAAAGWHWYSVLDVPQTASVDEIKRAFRDLALLHHPDKNMDGDDTTFKEIKSAYEQGLRVATRSPSPN